MRQAKEVVDRICKEFADQGKLIEAGWKDLRRMDLIDKELRNYIEEFKLRTATAKGTA